MKNYGIRNKVTGELEARFEDPIEARINLPDTDHEVVERTFKNVVRRFPDGRVFIVGTIEDWVKYQ